MMKLLGAGLLAAGPAMAWWDGGHMLTSQVAQEVLRARGQASDIEVLETMLGTNCEFANYSSLTTAATWADKIKAYRAGAGYGPIFPDVTIFNAMHYLDMPLRVRGPHSSLTDEELTTQWITNATFLGAHTVINSALRMAAEGYPAERGTVWGHDMLIRLLVHVVGDLHMPLHSVECWDEAWCKSSGKCTGDQGGNYWRLNYDGVTVIPSSTASNLHALWDSGCGLWPVVSAEETPQTELDEMTKAFMTENTEAILKKDGYDLSHDIKKYMIESYRMAIDGLPEDESVNVAPTGAAEKERGRLYVESLANWESDMDAATKLNPTFNLNDNYINWCQKAARRRVVLGGYRLADALHAVASAIPKELIASAKETKCVTKGVNPILSATLATTALLAAAIAL